MQCSYLFRSQRFPPRLLFAAVVGAGAFSACSQQPTEYSWSHFTGGEYLFAYDIRQCGRQAEQANTTIAARSDVVDSESPAFFDCMHDKGYFLVDPTDGQSLTVSDVIVESSLPQAVR